MNDTPEDVKAPPTPEKPAEIAELGWKAPLRATDHVTPYTKVVRLGHRVFTLFASGDAVRDGGPNCFGDYTHHRIFINEQDGKKEFLFFCLPSETTPADRPSDFGKRCAFRSWPMQEWKPKLIVERE